MRELPDSVRERLEAYKDDLEDQIRALKEKADPNAYEVNTLANREEDLKRTNRALGIKSDKKRPKLT